MGVHYLDVREGVFQTECNVKNPVVVLRIMRKEPGFMLQWEHESERRFKLWVRLRVAPKSVAPQASVCYGNGA